MGVRRAVRLALATAGIVLGFLVGAVITAPDHPLLPKAHAQIYTNSNGKASGFTHYISTASTNANLVKTGQATLYSITAVNTNAATAYLKFYNLAVAPTCNSTPVIATFPLVQNTPLTAAFPNGGVVGNGLGLCITGAQADNDNTNATTGITVTVTYK